MDKEIDSRIGVMPRRSEGKIGKIVRSLVFLALVFAMLCAYTRMLRDKNEASIVLPFYREPKDSLDVVFVGSSHFMCGVYPMELYDEFGYTSYVFASSAQLLPQTYWQTVEMLSRQSPRLVVVDVGNCFYKEKYGMKSYSHVQTDNMPFSLNKVKLINDLFDEEDRLPYYLNIIQFHSRWKELTSDDVRPIRSVTKGAYVSFDSKDVDLTPVPDRSDVLPIPENARTYLIKIIELCKSKKIPVLLVNMPGKNTLDESRTINSVWSISEEYDVPFINFAEFYTDLGIDPHSDFRDEYHLNAFGAIKTTRYLGRYISENYPDKKERSSGVSQKWENDLAAYRETYPVGYTERAPES